MSPAVGAMATIESAGCTPAAGAGSCLGGSARAGAGVPGAAAVNALLEPKLGLPWGPGSIREGVCAGAAFGAAAAGAVRLVAGARAVLVPAGRLGRSRASERMPFPSFCGTAAVSPSWVTSTTTTAVSASRNGRRGLPASSTRSLGRTMGRGSGAGKSGLG